jgi:hypothetical protein
VPQQRVAATFNEARTAALFTVMLNDFDPNSASGLEWYKRFLDISADVERNSSLSLGLTSGPAPGFDGVILAVSFFPTMIGITGAAIFVVMGIALKSVLMPIRALFAVGLTLVFSYGSAALVYEWGVLNWLGVVSLHTVAGDRSGCRRSSRSACSVACASTTSCFSCCASRTIGG